MSRRQPGIQRYLVLRAPLRVGKSIDFLQVVGLSPVLEPAYSCYLRGKRSPTSLVPHFLVHGTFEANGSGPIRTRTARGMSCPRVGYRSAMYQ
jgi:hypothetical protein